MFYALLIPNNSVDWSYNRNNSSQTRQTIYGIINIEVISEERSSIALTLQRVGITYDTHFLLCTIIAAMSALLDRIDLRPWAKRAYL